MSNQPNAFDFEFIGDSIKPDYRTLPKDIRVGLYVLQNGRFIHLNRNARRILGVPDEDADALLNKPFWQLIHPGDHRLVKLRQKATAAPFAYSRPFRMFRPDGSTVWVAMQGHNTTIDGRRANLGYLIDMRSMRYLKRALEKYRARITLVEDVVAEIDLKGNIRAYTQAAFDMWGIVGDEMIGKNYRSVMEKTSADIVRRAYHEVYETGLACSNIVYEIFRKDGRRLVVEDSVTLIRDGKGRPDGFQMVSRDITRQKEAEEQLSEQSAHLEAIFRSVNDAIITVDPELKIIDANQATRTICGIDLTGTAGHCLPDHMTRCSAMCLRVLRKTLVERKNIDNYLVECKHENNLRQVASICCSALMHPNDKFMGAVMVIRDDTRRHDLERKLQPSHRYHNLIGKSKKMQEIFDLVEDLADLDTTVLITGESGTGKNMTAQALHARGCRSNAPFITVNCSALAENLLESELFGHARGAFTGAIANRKGRFEAAHGGTIVIDEIGDLSHLTQLKLLRVLQEKQIERVGESIPRKVNVRVIACTNKNLKQKVGTGEFREDLYYRLKVVELVMPPLRHRPEDVPLLIEHFSRQFNKKYNRNISGLSNNAMARLLDYGWPGNVRELEHTLERAFILCNETRITESHLTPEIVNHRAKRRKLPPVEKNQKQKIREALEACYWNKTEAAELLGVSRQTLYRKMKAYGLMA